MTSANTKAATPVTNGTATGFPRKIVVIEGQWNVLGEVEETGTHLIIHGATVLRRWGTTMGLGEIALRGATANTVADNYGTVQVPLHQVIMLIDVVHDRPVKTSGL